MNLHFIELIEALYLHILVLVNLLHIILNLAYNVESDLTTCQVIFKLKNQNEHFNRFVSFQSKCNRKSTKWRPNDNLTFATPLAFFLFFL